MVVYEVLDGFGVSRGLGRLVGGVGCLGVE